MQKIETVEHCPFCRCYVAEARDLRALTFHDSEPTRADPRPFTFHTALDDRHRTECRMLQLECPKCGQSSFYIGSVNSRVFFQVYPRPIAGFSFPVETADVSDDLMKDIEQVYEEARRVLDDSARASAALSRTCLAMSLRKLGYTGKTLRKLVDAALASGNLGPSLRRRLPEIQHIGNWAVHPEKSDDPDKIVPIEPGEAEWLLDTPVILFEECFVLPRIEQERAAEIAKKYGAPPASKSP